MLVNFNCNFSEEETVAKGDPNAQKEEKAEDSKSDVDKPEPEKTLAPIIGGVVGGVVALLIIIVIAIAVVRKRHRARK